MKEIVRLNHLNKIVRKELFGVISILCILIIIFSTLSKEFTSYNNFFNILRESSALSIMSIGAGIIIIIGEIDLSVASISAITGLLSVMSITQNNLPVFIGILIGLLVGGLFGLINGILVVYAKLPAFITTLGMLSVVRGLAYALSGGLTYPISVKGFTNLGMGYLGVIPYPVLILFSVAIIFNFLCKNTIYGRFLYSIGGNKNAAFFSGVKVKKVTIITFILGGILYALAGILSAAKIGLGSSTAGLGYELEVMTAVVLGGVSLKGGQGNVSGIIIGAFIMGVLKNGLVLMGVSAYWQTGLIGATIIIVTSLDLLWGRRLDK